MSEQAPRWVDAPEFDWVPEQPFRAEPHFRGTPEPAKKAAASNKTAKPSGAASEPEARRRAPGYLLIRLGIGLAQGLCLLSLAAGYGDPACGLALLLTPLLLLAGLGRIPGRLLLPWTSIAGLGLLVLGAYQQWRAPGEVGFAMLGLAASALFIGQAFVTVWGKTGAPLAPYPAYFQTAWPLATQILLGVLTGAGSFILAGLSFALLRQQYPGPHPQFPVTLVVTLSVALMSWLASPALVRFLTRGLLATLTLALPLLGLLAAAAGAAGLTQHWQPPLLLCLGFGAALLVCLNASYRDGTTRPHWREITEFAAAFALTAPVWLGWDALSARVGALGWTGPRILAAAALLLLAAYALFAMASALISLGGGRWMKRMERANLGLALVALALLAALASPLADPARLAVASQVQRLSNGKVLAGDFDFAWLREGGGRFGHGALVTMAADKAAPDQARGAFVALSSQPDAARPPPTEIGANIDVRTPRARLPSRLLGRDWSEVTTPGVPPCLTSAALPCDAYFLDMDGDGRNEIVLVYGNAASWWGAVMKQGIGGGWYVAGTLAAPSCRGTLEALRAGRFAPVDPLPGWRDLLIAGTRLTVVSPGKQAVCYTP